MKIDEITPIPTNIDKAIESYTSFEKRIKELFYKNAGISSTLFKDKPISQTLLFCEQVKKMRKLNEVIEGQLNNDEENAWDKPKNADDELKTINKKTNFDQKREEENFINAFKNLNVHIRFAQLIVTDDYVIWGGTINGVITFVYKVTEDKQIGGVEIKYLEDFSEDNPENEEIIKMINSYYDTFFKYWNENLMQK